MGAVQQFEVNGNGKFYEITDVSAISGKKALQIQTKNDDAGADYVLGDLILWTTE